MKTIFKAIYGSHLYGTNVATSDTDVKGVYLPSAEDILLLNTPSTHTENTNKNSDRKNTTEDVDLQLTSLKKFLHDLMTGQTYALEFLFTPKDKWVEEPDPIWIELVKNKDKFISKNITAMVSYARAQAYKYGDKGKRFDVFRDVIDFLHRVGFTAKLSYLTDMNGFKEVVKKHSEFISIHKKENDTSEVEYLDVNGVMVPLGSSVEYALDVYRPRLEEYGARAKQAAADKGQDLKALYHAVRIAYQAEELLKTGNITLPSPIAPLLLEIRNGKLTESEIKQVIDKGFEDVREAEKKSTLRDKADRKFADQFLFSAHLGVIEKYQEQEAEHLEELMFKATENIGWNKKI